MSIETLKARLPDYAKDIKLNLGAIVHSNALTDAQVWGAMLAAACAARSGPVIEAVANDAARRLAPERLRAARAAAAIMAMNNVYYRATHLMGDDDLRAMPARLRMTVIGNPGVDKLDFELYALAVSAVNGCALCLEAHGREVQAKGASREAVQDTLRIAAVIHAAAATIDAETALALTAAA
jgi:alkyl hydroperoxide reductase subunit D